MRQDTTPYIILIAACLLILCFMLVTNPSRNQFDESDYNTRGADFTPICLDGVEYWVRAAGSKSYMSVRIDPETLQPRRCVTH